jgi:hypothetical protein
MDLTNKSQTFFKLVKGSNYKVTLINRTVYVIEYEQFMKLADVLHQAEVTFVTINSSFVNKARIENIDPTNELTVGQVEARNKRRNEQEQRIRDEDTIAENTTNVLKDSPDYTKLREKVREQMKKYKRTGREYVKNMTT